MSLPAELRNAVYDLVLPTEVLDNKDLGILGMNRKVREETCSTIFELTPLIIKVDHQGISMLGKNWCRETKTECLPDLSLALHMEIFQRFKVLKLAIDVGPLKRLPGKCQNFVTEVALEEFPIHETRDTLQKLIEYVNANRTEPLSKVIIQPVLNQDFRELATDDEKNATILLTIEPLRTLNTKEFGSLEDHIQDSHFWLEPIPNDKTAIAQVQSNWEAVRRRNDFVRTEDETELCKIVNDNYLKIEKVAQFAKQSPLNKKAPTVMKSLDNIHVALHAARVCHQMQDLRHLKMVQAEMVFRYAEAVRDLQAELAKASGMLCNMLADSLLDQRYDPRHYFPSTLGLAPTNDNLHSHPFRNNLADWRDIEDVQGWPAWTGCTIVDYSQTVVEVRYRGTRYFRWKTPRWVRNLHIGHN